MIAVLTRLYELCERETELVASGDAEGHELQAISEERTTLVAALPASIPAELQPALQAVVAQHQITLAVLRSERDRIGRGLHQQDRRTTAAHGYAAGVVPVAEPILDGLA